jgi:hypothetical protein
MALSVVLFLGCYVAYVRALGMVNGLPPLPEQFWPKDGPPPPPKEHTLSLVDKKLEQSFGHGCPELKCPIKIEVPMRGFVLASKEVTFMKDGRVSLIPMSLAVYGKTRGEDGTPEINTIRGDVAYLTFDQPIRTMADMGKHKIVASEVSGNIRIVNNRRSQDRGDDIAVDISKGPLYYDQQRHVIWTEDYVHLEDAQSTPRPTEISGQGMVLDLLAEEPPARRGQHRGAHGRQPEVVTGVKHVLLKSAVDMHLYVDANSGFLANNPTKEKEQTAKPPEKAKPGMASEKDKTAPEKAHIIIKTQGPFNHDLIKNLARFDIPRVNPASRVPEFVIVQRVIDSVGKFDQLVCDHLEIQFRKKEEQAPAKSPAKPRGAKQENSSSSMNLQIETAHATGGTVVLSSDGESLEAHGHDFFYDARILTTTLKGKPNMWAMKEGNEIYAPQLQIQNTKDGQTARAAGPGRLSLLDKNTGKRTMKAVWQSQLESTREGLFDLLHLTGKAAFIDAENNQELSADDLRVWLLPEESKGKAAPTTRPPVPAEKKSQQQSRRPHHLIATGNVRSHSKDFNIKDSQRLVVWFNDAPPPPPGAAPVSGQPGNRESKPAPAPSPAANSEDPAQPGKKPGPGDPTKPAPAPEKKPIDLWGRSVEAHILRIGDKMQPQRVRSEGAVHVIQAPAKPGEKGVDITGETLQLNAYPEGNVLVVTSPDVARLEMDRMLILGPEVNIDQVANKAWVNGIGAMTIESENDFKGEKLKKPSPLTIHWNRAMVFTGPLAVFHGGIQADQDNARLTCQELQVFFDKPISLKEGQKEKDKAQVRNLVCDKSAHVEDMKVENGKLIELTILRSPAVAYDNEEGTVHAAGPGEVRMFRLGGESPGLDSQPPRPQRAKAGTAPTNKKEEPKLTYVSYYARMNGYRKNHLAIFYTNVRVLHLPSDNPHMEIDLDKILGKQSLPEGSMYMRCDKLKVFSRPHGTGKSTQVMEADGRVSVMAPEFHGEAERVTYDEEKDQVIFDGGSNGTSTLWKEKIRGQEWQMIQGKKIIYDRRSGRHAVQDADIFKGQ